MEKAGSRASLSRLGAIAAVFVIGMLVTPIGTGVASASAPTVPYTPGYLYVIQGGSHFWESSSMPIPFYVNTGTIPANLGITSTQLITAVTGAFAAWEGDEGSSFDASYGGTTTRSHLVSNQLLYNWDDKNDIWFGELYGTAPGGGSLDEAQAFCIYDYDLSGRIVEADIILDITKSDGTLVQWAIGNVDHKIDLQGTITHEVGHFLGLKDVGSATFDADEYSTMFFATLFTHVDEGIWSDRKRTPEKGDLAGLRYLYGYKRTVDSSIGYYHQGCDIDVWDVSRDGTKDYLAAWIDNPSGSNYIYYRLGTTISSDTGAAASWGTRNKWSTAIGSDTAGLGVALAYIDGDAYVDVIFAWVERVTGADNAKYVIGWDLSTVGVPTSWSAVKSISHGSWTTNGVDVDVANVAGGIGNDLVFLYVDSSAELRYKVGVDLNTAGDPTMWNGYYSVGSVVSTNGAAQECGVAVGDFDHNGLCDIVFSAMEYHTAAGLNKAVYKVGWNVGTSGQATGWTGWVNGPVMNLGTECDGFGLACANLDNYPTGAYGDDLIFMYVDDPSAQNTAYQYVEWEGRLTGSHG